MGDIPVPHPRSLVLCFDGTSDEYDKDNSNVVKFFALLKKDPNQQVCYYDPGIGTWFHPGVVSPLFNWAAKVMDLATAWYLDAHVLDGYKFLMQNYREGDKISIFGFSRGAYTARALAGFLHKIGLLSKDNVVQIPFAYKLYKRQDQEGNELAEGFKATFCQPVRIDFLGVWDTVASVGIIMGKTLPFTNSNSSITTFRHALALDERRARFRPSFYHRPSPTFMNAELDPENASSPVKSDSDSSKSSSSSSDSDGSKRSGGKKSSKLRRVLSKDKEKQVAGSSQSPTSAKGEPLDDVLEVWFIGGHSDVGGGNTLNKDHHSLSNISLRWMVKEVIKSNCGIKFNAEAIPPLKLDASDEVDEIDALEPINDRLTGSFSQRLWWLLEIIPLSYAWQDKDGVWHRSYGWHFGRGRDIHDPKPKFHRTVQIRAASKEGYKPKAKWTAGTEEYVS